MAAGRNDTSQQAVAALGRTLVLVPHPDDETLGCGGLLALLARVGAAVCVVLMTDGTGSHRQSHDYPPTRMSALRQLEMTAALRELGHAPDTLVALGLRDGAVPTHSEPGFDALVARLVCVVSHFGPHTVLLPTHNDGHPDHRATHAAGCAACCVAAPQAMRLEYPVWSPQYEPSRSAWHLDISAVLDSKQRALAQHRSQLGQVVHDDPQGFSLPPDLLARCALAVEVYFLAGATQVIST